MYDLLIKNAKIVAGCGGPWFRGDAAVTGGRIKAVGKVFDKEAVKVIDAQGKVLSPGFIDAHSHADFVCSAVNDSLGKVAQGVTTEVVGNCGLSMAPVGRETLGELQRYLAPFMPDGVENEWSWEGIGGWMDLVDRKGNSTNIATLIGHGALRIRVMGFEDRKPRAAELEKMKEILAGSMEEGALGLSTGLIYPPGCFSDTEELVELSKVVARHGGIYVTHLRNEGPELIPAMEEALRIGRESGCAVQISHHKSSGRRNFGQVDTTLKMMESARAEGMDVTCDAYPYTAGSTLMSSLLPKWAHEGGVARMLERLGDGAARKRIAGDLQRDIPGWENLARGAGWENILICSCEVEPGLEGKTVAGIAEERDVTPEECLMDVLLEAGGKATIALFMMSEDDYRKILAHRLSMVGSDGFAFSFGGVLSKGKPHPRSFGTFPRVLGKYVREEGVLTLEDAVWKMTGFPAERFGLEGRGLVKEGMTADLVVFDPGAIIDRARYDAPHQQPEGIDYVIMNGEIVMDHGKWTGKTVGRALR